MDRVCAGGKHLHWPVTLSGVACDMQERRDSCSTVVLPEMFFGYPALVLSRNFSFAPGKMKKNYQVSVHLCLLMLNSGDRVRFCAFCIHTQ